MDAHMATLFGGEAWDLCFKLGRAMSKTQLSPQVPQILLHIIIKYDFTDISPYFSDYLGLTSWDFASMLGLANMSGTWDPV